LQSEIRDRRNTIEDIDRFAEELSSVHGASDDVEGVRKAANDIGNRSVILTVTNKDVTIANVKVPITSTILMLAFCRYHKLAAGVLPQSLPSASSPSRHSTHSPEAQESFLKWARQMVAKMEAIESEMLAPSTGLAIKLRGGKQHKEKELLKKIKVSYVH